MLGNVVDGVSILVKHCIDVLCLLSGNFYIFSVMYDAGLNAPILIYNYVI